MKRKATLPAAPTLAAGLAVLALLAAPVAASARSQRPVQQGGHGAHAPQAASADDPHAAHRAAAEGAAAPGAAVERGTARAVEGLSIPDVEVIDQDGRPRRFFTDLVAGKTVAMNFVFTTCTTICPPMGANFGHLQRELGDRLGRDVHLVSVSVDPVTDTPERLRAWGEKFGAAAGWTLVTGERSEITRLLKALEVFTPDVREHSPVVLLGNQPRGDWTRAYGLAPPAKLAEILDGIAAPGGAADRGAVDRDEPETNGGPR